MSRVRSAIAGRLAAVVFAYSVTLAGVAGAPAAAGPAAAPTAPVVFSTYLGGAYFEVPQAVAVDGCGNVYVGGFTASYDFPSTTAATGPLSVYHGGDGDGFLTKFTPDGSRFVYTAFLGGDGADAIAGLAVDAAGAVYVTGSTTSPLFPATTTIGAVGGRSAFVAKIDPSGRSLVYATRFGGSGSSYGSAIAIDADGNAYVAGATDSVDFPSAGPGVASAGKAAGADEGGDAFVAKLAPDGSHFVYARRVGGLLDDHAEAIAVDATGAAVVAGATLSYDFPSVSPLPNPTPDTPGNEVGFVTKVNPEGSGIVYSTILPHTRIGFGVAADANGNAYVTGISRFDFATTANPFSLDEAAFVSHAFLAKLPPAGGSLDYAIEIGGDGGDVGGAVAVDASGRVYVAGATTSGDFPNRPPGRRGDADAFVVRLGADASTVELARTIGGTKQESSGFPKVAMGVSPAGEVAIAGNTSSSDFPTTANALRTALDGVSDGYVVAFAGDGVAPPVVASARAVQRSDKPLRVDLAGSGFETGTRVYVGDDAAPWPKTVVRDCGSIRLKGPGLDARLPTGTPVTIRVVNSDGSEASVVLAR